MFVRNAWYVAAIERDISRQMLPVTILGERIVLFAKEDGTPVALEDACPHRKLPLSMGRLQRRRGRMRLSRADASTAAAPARGCRAPRRSRMWPRCAAYPLLARYGLVWIWMGDAAAADPAADLPGRALGRPEPGAQTDGESMTVDCNYLYVTDNLLDPSHVAWVHPRRSATPPARTRRCKTELRDDGVMVSRWMLDTELAPFYAAVRQVRRQLRPQAALRGPVPEPRDHQGHLHAGEHRRPARHAPSGHVPDGLLQFHDPDRRAPDALLLVPDAQLRAGRRRRVAAFRRQPCAVRSRRTGSC